MSKCSVFFLRMLGQRYALCALIAIPWLSTAMVTPAQAQVNAAVTIETVYDFPLGDQLELSVDLTGRDMCTQTGGFSLAIVFDPNSLAIHGVDPGQSIQECDWEYFNYVVDTVSDFPDGWTAPVVRINAVAGTSASGSPAGDTLQQLARLTFGTTSHPAAAGSLIPVRFLWLDCTDNAVTDPTGDSLYVSDHVFDVGDGWELTEDAEFPTLFGMPDVCLDTVPGVTNQLVRAVDFYNGGVQFALDDTTNVDTLDAVVMVNQNHWACLGDYVDISINLNYLADGFSLGGFDFMLQFDPGPVTFFEAVPGQMLDDCAWEYFNYQYEPPDTLGEGRGYLHLVALAETNNGAIHPTCFGYTGGELAVLRFHIPPDQNLLGQTIAINWLWTDCFDNTLADSDGYWLLLSRKVYDNAGFDVTAADTFPTTHGTQEHCVAGNDRVVRSVDFFSGGITAIGHCIDDRGDLNLNAISYEIADWVIFGNYFYFGLDAFTIDPEQQSANSDINADGVELSLLDFVYLYGIIVGVMDPVGSSPPPLETATAYFVQNTDSRVVSVGVPDSLAAVKMLFEGEITPSLLIDTTNLGWWYDFDGYYTRIMIYPVIPFGPITDNGKFFSGPLISYTGNGTLVAAEAATYRNLIFDISIEFEDPTTPALTVRIDTARVNLGDSATIDLLLEECTEELGGFNFLLAYDDAGLQLMGVQPGPDFFEGCEWEYFTFRMGFDTSCAGNCPSGMVRIVGLADQNDGLNHPLCFLPENLPAVMARLQFRVTYDRTFRNIFAPLKFFWIDCTDNALSDETGLELYLGSEVYDFPGTPIPSSTEFPSYGGPVAGCFNTGSPHPTTAAVSFYNGGIEILESDSSHVYGDLNLNGIAYELADAILFAKYFLYGLSVFPEPVEAAVAASDINRDGIPLTIEDFIMMLRIMLGEFFDPAAGEPSPNIAYFHYNPATGVISVDTPDTLGAVLFGFDGEIAPVLLQPQVMMQPFTDSDQTGVLIAPITTTAYIMAGDLISFTGEGSPVEVTAATYDGRTVEVRLDSPTSVDDPFGEGLPDRFNLEQNYPNPFNPSTGISFSLPSATHARLEVYNVLGQTVSVLVNEHLAAGHYTYEFDGAGHASGIYFYRLVTEFNTDTRKMVLMK